VADRLGNDDRAGDRTQHEPHRDRQHVDDDDLLERSRVQRLQHDVGQRGGAELEPKRERHGEGGRGEHGSHDQRKRDGDVA